MSWFVSKENVEASIEYFKTAGFDPDDMLFLYLLGKHLGVTTTYPVTYLTSKLNEDQKAEYKKTIWMLGGLFDSAEKCQKMGVMFPAAFSKVALYQPGTDFSGLIGRVKDTIEKKNILVPLYKDNEGRLTLRENYRDLLQENALKGNKISLANLAAWVFRFTDFDFEAQPNPKQFTRVIEKAIRKYFSITKNDFLWLFENDLYKNRLSSASSGISGSQIRACFDFASGKSPVIEGPGQTPEQTSALTRETISGYLALNGDNPSATDIKDILLTKKQIVLTGVPGVGKSRYTQILSDDPFFTKTETIQFHASYSYEDFIGSETLKQEGNGTTISTKKGSFLNFVVDAREHPDDNYLFIIDELNRGNIAEIFGETILALDRDYCVKLSREYEGVTEFQLPDNLYIVATMNTSDRNIAFLDLAIRRRFGFVSLVPNYDFLSEDVTFEGFDLGNVLRIINQRIVDTLKDPELVLGQSYFIPPKTADGYVWDRAKFKNQFNFVLLPTIKEYSFNEPSAVNTIVGESLGDGIQDTEDFMKAFSSEFLT